MNKKLKLKKKVIANLSDTDTKHIKGGGPWPDLSQLVCDSSPVRCATVACQIR